MAEGYWPRIADRESAVAAVRMAGLPVFLIGASTLLVVLVSALLVLGSGLELAQPWVVLGTLGVSAALVILGLALRGGRAGLGPLAALMTLASAVAAVWAAPWWAMIVQSLMVLLALSGLRGWWWLRKNSA